MQMDRALQRKLPTTLQDMYVCSNKLTSITFMVRYLSPKVIWRSTFHEPWSKEQNSDSVQRENYQY